MVLGSSSFSLFHSGQVFHQLVCPLTVVLSQIFFSLITLFSYPVFCSLFHAPLDVVVHFLTFLRAFRFKSFLSQFSPFVASRDTKENDLLTCYRLITQIAYFREQPDRVGDVEDVFVDDVDDVFVDEHNSCQQLINGKCG